MPLDLSQSLDQIEQTDWGEPTYSSYLVTRCHQLRKIPLKDFSAEDLRIMIGQQISLQHLVPLALDVLGKKPLIAGNYYEGDLLLVVLRLPTSFWTVHPTWTDTVISVAQTALEEINAVPAAEKWLYSDIKTEIEVSLSHLKAKC